MIVHILQENLLRALSRTGRIVPSKPQLPILQNVLLTTEEGGLKVTATNLETTESVFVGAKVEQAGGICLSSKLFSEFVSTLPQDTVILRVTDEALSIQCGSFRATIPGSSAQEFPPIADMKKGEEITIEKGIFTESISRVVFAAATDEGRPLLTGIKIIQGGGNMTFVATDGYRLSVKKVTAGSSEENDLLIPARAITEVLKVSAEEKETKEISMFRSSEGQMAFIIGETELRTRLIDGDYVNYEKIIPTKFNTRVILEKEHFLRAVRSASIFARDSANIIRVKVENQKVVVSANTPQVGEDEIEIEARVDGEGGEMAFNSRFLQEFLSNFPEEELAFEMTGSLNPGVFKPVTDESYLHIIMPVRIQG